MVTCWGTGCFQILEIMSKAVINLCVQVFVWMCVFNSVGPIPRSMTTGLYGKSMFSLVKKKKNYQTVFPRGCTILHSPQQTMSFCCFASSPAFGVVSVLESGPSNRCAVVFHWFHLHFPDDMWCGTSFYVFICHLSSLMKCLLRSLVHFLTWVICFLLVEF